ncbi:MAG: 50S ribosomal protein L32 [Planctomycetes bacterium]|nr:50S ribosomal protein L32 [Planctomycetota bacterium]
MAVPKRRVSRSRRGNRRRNQGVPAAELVKCAHCSTMIRPHHICPSCGHYRKKGAIIATRASS